MKILWDCGNVGYGGCGINEWDRNVVNSLRCRGHEVTLIIDKSFSRRPKFKSWIPPEGGLIFYDGYMTPDNYSEVVSSIGEFDFQIGNHFTMFPILKNIVPVVHDYHIPNRDSYTMGIKNSLRGLSKVTSRFLCTTPFIEGQVKEACPSSRTVSVYGGCKFSEFPSASTLGRGEEQGGYIAYWGNRYASNGKNFDSLLKTLPHHELDLIVSGFIPPSKEETDLVEKLGVVDRVTFHTGLTDEELYHIISGSSLYVCPSRYEGFGIPVVEAMSLGVPVVVSPCASLPSIVGRGGVVAKTHKSKDLVEAIKRVLNNQEETKERVEEGKRISSEWSWDKTAMRIERFLNEN